MTERELFIAALECDATARGALLDRECAGDAAMRARVEQLLQAHVQAGNFLNQPPHNGTAEFSPSPDGEPRPSIDENLTGQRIGPYRVLQKLGEGGMGSVWLAEQTEPVRRQVALKLIKAGMDTSLVLARFEAERHALALMDHPNIARILDAGTTAAGRPYFVMELVKGIAITTYCDQSHLTPIERLELFIPVCQAVQHAHQKGIIHRDLKPSNIMVGLYDGRPVPKIIDFGVAKATRQRLTERTMHTEVGNIIGTLEYMAPEQAEVNNLDIDTRADIYSLGVILYELLAGSPPFSSKQLRGAGYSEMLRVIREVEPQKPSTKLSSSDELPSIAANRRSEPKRLTKSMHGDLDWIVMKCLEKDRARRYETANGIASELQRHLAGEPVMAGPPGVSYRLSKFLRRNKRSAVAVSLILVTLIVGIVGTTAGFLQARAAAHAERQARDLAQGRLAQIEKGNEILGSIFRSLDPRAEEKGGPLLQEQLTAGIDRAAERLTDETIGDPLALARLRHTLGESYSGLGHPKKAIDLLTKARQTFTSQLGLDSPDTLEAANNLAQAFHAADQLDRALPLYEDTFERRKQALGPLHEQTLSSANNLATAYQDTGHPDRAVTMLEEVLRLLQAGPGPDHADTLATMNNLALAYQAVAQFDKAVSLLEEVARRRDEKLGSTHPLTLGTRNNLAGAYQANGQIRRAVLILEDVLKLTRDKLGPEHPDTLTAMNNVAFAQQMAGRLDLAIPIFEKAVEFRKQRLGHEHRITLMTISNLAGAKQEAGRPDQAVPLLEDTVRAFRIKLGPEHPDTMVTMNNLARAYQMSGKLPRAIELFEETIRLRTNRLGADHPLTIMTNGNLAGALQASGQMDRAISLMEETRLALVAKLGENHPDTMTAMNNLAFGYHLVGKLDSAIQLFETTVRLRRDKLGAEHPLTMGTQGNLVQAYDAARRFDDAARLSQEMLTVQRGKSPADDGALSSTLVLLGVSLLHADRPAEAESPLREALTIREKQQPDAWATFNARSLLGGALADQKKHVEAEPLLVQGYEGLSKRAHTIPPTHRSKRLVEALERLIRLYDTWNKPDEVAKWRTELDAIKAGMTSKP